VENLILYFVKIHQTEPPEEKKSYKRIKCKKYGTLRGWLVAGGFVEDGKWLVKQWTRT